MEAKPDTYKELLEIYSNMQLLPSIITEHEINASPPAITNRVRLIDAERKLSIDLLSNRIVASRQLTSPETSMDTDINDFCEEAKNLLKPIITKYSWKSKRLALVVSGVFHDLSTDTLKRLTMNAISNKFIEDPENLEEWLIRTVKRYPLMNYKEDMLNVVINLGRSKLMNTVNKMEYDGFHVIFDINTIPENQALRFTTDDIDTFIEQAKALQKENEKRIEAWMDGGN